MEPLEVILGQLNERWVFRSEVPNNERFANVWLRTFFKDLSLWFSIYSHKWTGESLWHYFPESNGADFKTQIQTTAAPEFWLKWAASWIGGGDWDRLRNSIEHCWPVGLAKLPAEFSQGSSSHINQALSPSQYFSGNWHCPQCNV